MTVRIIQGDCLDLLPTLDDASVDAICTDPPYALSFMGREWDSFGPRQKRAAEVTPTRQGHSTSAGPYLAAGIENLGQGGHPFQFWCEQWAVECLRVLKPGGHMLAFGGTRTFHRLACAIEDAGFEIRDSIAWLYGCLTDDVEVLTPSGWRRGVELREGDEVAQWNPKDAVITIASVQQTFRAPWSGDLVRFRNTDTDQALTPNHRVWHRASDHRGRAGKAWHEWSDYRVAEAAAISRRSPVRVPLAGQHHGPGIGGEDYAALLGWVWTEGGFDKGSSTGVRIFQSSVNQPKCDEIAALLDRLAPHKRYDYAREYTRRNGELHTYVASTWFFTGELAQRVRADLPDKHPTYALLWRMTLAEKRAFIRAALLGDGSQGSNGAWQFYQNDAADRQWFTTALALVGWRGCDYERKPPRTGGSVSVSQRADTTMSPAALADVREFYEGDVWCIRVPTGAFVARRNGKVFVTGNSGFPKSLDVSKAIDKAAGAEREARRWRSADSEAFGNAAGFVGRVCLTCGRHAGSAAANCQCQDAAPATDDARTWQGWGTALKPAFEPVIVARKPLSSSVAANVLRHGTGAINVDGCRIGTAEPLGRFNNARTEGSSYVVQREAGLVDNSGGLGRWPANVILDESQARELDLMSGWTSSIGKPRPRSGSRAATQGATQGGTQGGYNLAAGEMVDYGDSGGASRFFYVAKADSAERPRYRKEGAGEGRIIEGASGKIRRCNVCGNQTIKPSATSPACGHDDFSFVPTAKRDEYVSHPTVKPLALMRWLVRLVTPPGGTVLDPFAGSGTTGEACQLEGFHCILMEREAEYIPLIEQRLAQGVLDFDFDGESA